MKNITLKVLAAVCILSAPALAVAGTPQIIGDAVPSYTIGSQIIKPSNNVHLGIISNDATYAAKSAHTKGDRAFGTNSVESKIYYFDCGANAAVGSVDPSSNWGNGSNEVYTGTGWSSL